MAHPKRLMFAVSGALLTAGACTKSQPPPEDHVNPGPIEEPDAADDADAKEEPQPEPEDHVNPGPIEEPDEIPQDTDGPKVVPDGDAPTPRPVGKVNPGPIRDPQKRPASE